MMGRRENGQGQFFYSFDLDEVVPPDHLVTPGIEGERQACRCNRKSAQSNAARCLSKNGHTKSKAE